MQTPKAHDMKIHGFPPAKLGAELVVEAWHRTQGAQFRAVAEAPPGNSKIGGKHAENSGDFLVDNFVYAFNGCFVDVF